MLYAALLNDGDYIFALRGMFGEATPLMRGILGGAGAALYLLSVGVSRTLLQPFATAAGRVAAILRIAWIAAAIGAVAAALLYAPDRLGAAKQALLEVGVAAAPLMLLPRGYQGGAAAPLRLNPVWIVTAAAIYIAFALTLGVGVAS